MRSLSSGSNQHNLFPNQLEREVAARRTASEGQKWLFKQPLGSLASPGTGTMRPDCLWAASLLPPPLRSPSAPSLPPMPSARTWGPFLSLCERSGRPAPGRRHCRRDGLGQRARRPPRTVRGRVPEPDSSLSLAGQHSSTLAHLRKRPPTSDLQGGS